MKDKTKQTNKKNGSNEPRGKDRNKDPDVQNGLEDTGNEAGEAGTK